MEGSERTLLTILVPQIDNFHRLDYMPFCSCLQVFVRNDELRRAPMNVHEYLEFRHLKYILAIAETGTFTAAAARLHVSQSAISAQIAALEENLGFLILDRENGNALTTEGR